MKHHITSLLSLGFLAAFSTSSYAQSFVLGSGPEKGCYEKALFGDTGSRDALELCDLALESPLSHSNRASTHNNRGILLMKKGDFEKAKKDYERAIELSPSLSEVQINYAALLMKMNEDDAALKALNIAIQDTDNKKLAVALYNRSIIYDGRQKYKAAYQDLKQALEIRPEWPAAQRALKRYEVVSKPSG